MEPYYINVDDEILTVQPEDDGTYTIFKDGVRIALIFADINFELKVDWETGDLIPKEYAQKIGMAIENYEM